MRGYFKGNRYCGGDIVVGGLCSVTSYIEYNSIVIKPKVKHNIPASPEISSYTEVCALLASQIMYVALKALHNISKHG